MDFHSVLGTGCAGSRCFSVELDYCQMGTSNSGFWGNMLGVVNTSYLQPQYSTFELVHSDRGIVAKLGVRKNTAPATSPHRHTGSATIRQTIRLKK